MKKLIVILIIILFSSCEVGNLKNGITQENYKNMLITYVWWNGEIVKADYDVNMTDSLVLLRQKEGDSLIAILDKMR